jgi:hypothetical protein
MTATVTTTFSGLCVPSGGELSGEAKPKDPSTFCCRGAEAP